MSEGVVPSLVGPFVGVVEATSATLWLHLPRLAEREAQDIHVTLHADALDAPATASGVIRVTWEELRTGTVRLTGLQPDTNYAYRLWHDSAHTRAMDLEGLDPGDLHFRTLPVDGYDGQLDFLLMSCHDPFLAAKADLDGHGMWKAMPRILEENRNVRLAVMCGDQVYNDDIEAALLAETDPRKRQEMILGVYAKYWSDPAYRKVLCSLPSVLMWDDHDIADGWGSREESFVDKTSSTFKPEWLGLFEAARATFAKMQASRNPPPLSDGSFDTCFKIGRAGFIVADLRSNKNVRKQQMWRPEQLESIKAWVSAVRDEIDTLFFVSTVVFSHGDQEVEQAAGGSWGVGLKFFGWLKNRQPTFGFSKWLVSFLLNRFDSDLAGLRDDINDSWGAKANATDADAVLDFLFGLQNPPANEKPLAVVILTGDIHTAGFSTVYSYDENHRRSVIPHIAATPVSSPPSSWFTEAVYRHLGKVVPLGTKKKYTSQVSHHYCHRNVVVISLREMASEERLLKVKFYLEGFTEPQTLVIDLKRGSHRENIPWADGSDGDSGGQPRPGGSAAAAGPPV